MSICIVNACTLQNKLGWSVGGGGDVVNVDVDLFTQHILNAFNKHMFIVRDPIHTLRVHIY